eukprot:4076826-Prymnesium_polylepis.1
MVKRQLEVPPSLRKAPALTLAAIHQATSRRRERHLQSPVYRKALAGRRAELCPLPNLRHCRLPFRVEVDPTPSVGCCRLLEHCSALALHRTGVFVRRQQQQDCDSQRVAIIRWAWLLIEQQWVHEASGASISHRRRLPHRPRYLRAVVPSEGLDDVT